MCMAVIKVKNGSIQLELQHTTDLSINQYLVWAQTVMQFVLWLLLIGLCIRLYHTVQIKICLIVFYTLRYDMNRNNQLK